MVAVGLIVPLPPLLAELLYHSLICPQVGMPSSAAGLLLGNPVLVPPQALNLESLVR